MSGATIFLMFVIGSWRLRHENTGSGSDGALVRAAGNAPTPLAFDADEGSHMNGEPES